MSKDNGLRIIECCIVDIDTGEVLGKSKDKMLLRPFIQENQKIMTWNKSFLRGLHLGKNLSLEFVVRKLSDSDYEPLNLPPDVY